VSVIAVCKRPPPGSELRAKYGAQYWVAIESTDRGQRQYMGVGRNRIRALSEARKTRRSAHG
jgi:hypothetical protein